MCSTNSTVTWVGSHLARVIWRAQMFKQPFSSQKNAKRKSPGNCWWHMMNTVPCVHSQEVALYRCLRHGSHPRHAGCFLSRHWWHKTLQSAAFYFVFASAAEKVTLMSFFLYSRWLDFVVISLQWGRKFSYRHAEWQLTTVITSAISSVQPVHRTQQEEQSEMQAVLGLGVDVPYSVLPRMSSNSAHWSWLRDKRQGGKRYQRTNFLPCNDQLGFSALGNDF